jgi:Trypsin-like peptidase domain
MEAVVVAMSSAFNPFPNGAQAGGPPPRKSVEYGTGLVVSDDGAIVTDRAVVDGCLSIVVAGQNLSSIGNADRTAEDRDHDLALLRIYGARGLKRLALNAGTAKSSVELTGIADPQNQGGGAAVSSVKAQAGGDASLTPAPGLGFSGSAALDADGVFAGVALLKPVVVAGPTITAGAAQASLISADIVREFLKANGISAASGAPDAKASVVRVICVRK